MRTVDKCKDLVRSVNHWQPEVPGPPLKRSLATTGSVTRPANGLFILVIGISAPFLLASLPWGAQATCRRQHYCQPRSGERLCTLTQPAARPDHGLLIELTAGAELPQDLEQLLTGRLNHYLIVAQLFGADSS